MILRNHSANRSSVFASFMCYNREGSGKMLTVACQGRQDVNCGVIELMKTTVYTDVLDRPRK